MPTARELLEQADALMRRNRSGGGPEGIPVLTESIAEALAEPSAQSPATRDSASAALDLQSSEVELATPPAANAVDQDLALALEQTEPEAATEPPVLTDVVEEEAVELLPLPAKPEDDEAALWLGPDTIDPALHSITGDMPDSVVVVPTHRAPARSEEFSAEAFDLPEPETGRTLRAAGSAPTPPPAASMPSEPIALEEAGEDERWRALAEQISMQVLQRLDLFVDTGLKAQLAAHLQPIVTRAGTELVEAINDHVGQLVRSYVAEAIEREIAQWRQGERS